MFNGRGPLNIALESERPYRLPAALGMRFS
jgi:hypothetical protein